jgi:hypothetical protein
VARDYMPACIEESQVSVFAFYTKKSDNRQELPQNPSMNDRTCKTLCSSKKFGTANMLSNVADKASP